MAGLKKYGLICSFFLLGRAAFAQVETVDYNAIASDSAKIKDLKEEFGKRKKMLQGFEVQTLIALSHFPELKEIEIVFQYNQSNSTFMTKPRFSGIFKKGVKRKFIITISRSKEPKISAILLKNLSFEAQIGILGHELSQVLDFCKMKSGKLLGHALRYSFSKKYADQLEFQTDRICIQHGLGQALWAYSNFIRQTYQVENWRGAANYVRYGESQVERYMNPDTIQEEIKRHLSRDKDE